MPQIELTPVERKALKGQAHHLNPVVMIGADGLTDAVRKETEAALNAHGLIKIRVLGDDRAAREGISVQQAQQELLREKEPSLQFTTPAQLGVMAVFLCSAAADNMRGIAWANDGGWTAQ